MFLCLVIIMEEEEPIKKYPRLDDSQFISKITQELQSEFNDEVDVTYGKNMKRISFIGRYKGQEKNNKCFSFVVSYDKKNIQIVSIKLPNEYNCKISGKEILNKLKRIAEKNGIERITLKDASVIRNLDGNDLYSLAIYSLLRKGKSWYEREGFHQIGEADDFREKLEELRITPISEIHKIRNNNHLEKHVQTLVIKPIKEKFGDDFVDFDKVSISELLSMEELQPTKPGIDNLLKDIVSVFGTHDAISLYDEQLVYDFSPRGGRGIKKSRTRHRRRKSSRRFKKDIFRKLV